MKKLLSTAGAIALISAPPFDRSADAAPAAATDSGGTLEEIVVTAEKRNSTVQDTPISMTAISGDQLLRQGTQTVEELVGVVPGVSMRTAGPGQTEYEMRGLGA